MTSVPPMNTNTVDAEKANRRTAATTPDPSFTSRSTTCLADGLPAANGELIALAPDCEGEAMSLAPERVGGARASSCSELCVPCKKDVLSSSTSTTTLLKLMESDALKPSY